MIAHGDKIKLFCGNSCKALAEAIAVRLKMKLSQAEVGKFSDGEISVSDALTIMRTALELN